MATTATRNEFVSMVADEIFTGIEDALDYWLGRVECELTASGLTAIEQLRAIERILREYKEATGKAQLQCAHA
jgi:hypothetical protein